MRLLSEKNRAIDAVYGEFLEELAQNAEMQPEEQTEAYPHADIIETYKAGEIKDTYVAIKELGVGDIMELTMQVFAELGPDETERFIERMKNMD